MAGFHCSSIYGCHSQEQNGGQTPRNLLSSDDERVPVELIRVAFIKKCSLRSKRFLARFV